jgi:hypothetical protein
VWRAAYPHKIPQELLGGGEGDFCGVGSSPNKGNLLKVLISFLLIQTEGKKRFSPENFLNILSSAHNCTYEPDPGAERGVTKLH